MQTAILIRNGYGDCTLGTLYAGDLKLQTMEPPWRDNTRNESCIPVGYYKVCQHVSPRFGRCFIVLNVEHRSHILFHSGNVVRHTKGCILPGLRKGYLKGQRAVLSSRTAMRHLMSWAGDGFNLVIG